jgi:tRNA A-37 threonylcarbamoyl transferase component Bud32
MFPQVLRTPSFGPSAVAGGGAGSFSLDNGAAPVPTPQTTSQLQAAPVHPAVFGALVAELHASLIARTATTRNGTGGGLPPSKLLVNPNGTPASALSFLALADSGVYPLRTELRVADILTLPVLHRMGRIIARLHAANQIHGDLTTSNFIVTNAQELWRSWVRVVLAALRRAIDAAAGCVSLGQLTAHTPVSADMSSSSPIFGSPHTTSASHHTALARASVRAAIASCRGRSAKGVAPNVAQSASFGELVRAMRDIHDAFTATCREAQVTPQCAPLPTSSASAATAPVAPPTAGDTAAAPLPPLAPTAAASAAADVRVIDFGLVRESTNAEERGVDLYVLERAITSTHPLLPLAVSHVLDGYALELEDVHAAAAAARGGADAAASGVTIVADDMGIVDAIAAADDEAENGAPVGVATSAVDVNDTSAPAAATTTSDNTRAAVMEKRRQKRADARKLQQAQQSSATKKLLSGTLERLEQVRARGRKRSMIG